MATVELRVLTRDGEVADLASAWRSLLERSSDRSVFLTPEWVLTWWSHFGGDDELHVLAVFEGERLIGLAPFLRARFGSRRFFSMLVGIGQELADYGGFLLGDRPDVSGAAILDHLQQLIRTTPTVANLTRLHEDGDVLRELRKRFDGPNSSIELSLEQEETYPFLHLATLDDPAQHVARLEKRNDVRRRLRRLQEGSNVSFSYDVTPTVAAMEQMFRLHDQRWSEKRGTMTGLFAGQRRQHFAIDVTSALHEAGYARLSFLYADANAIAGRLGFEFDGRYQGLKSGFDPGFASFGPGHLIVAKVLEDLVERGLDEFEFMRGAGDHKRAWTQDERTVGYWMLHRQSTLGRAHRRLMWLLLALRQRRFAG